MKPGNKYHSLYIALNTSGQERVPLSFHEIERILGKPLPASARSRRDWWGNRKGTTHAMAWMEAGYHVLELDLESELVTFGKPVHYYQVRREGDTVAWNSDLIKALRYHMGLNQSDFAAQLGVRQQTISEWETGLYEPSRATKKYLTLVAEHARFIYHVGGEVQEEGQND